jgi:hypothetical protein
MWFKRKVNVEQSYIDRLTIVESKITRLSAEILDLNVSLDLVRDKVLRKIQKKREEEPEETKPINPFFSPLGGNYGNI